MLNLPTSRYSQHANSGDNLINNNLFEKPLDGSQRFLKMADNGDEDEAPGGGWLISYADLMTLLFAAFVVLYGITPQGESKEVLGVLSSIREAFVEIPDIIPDEERAGPLKKGKFVFKNFKGDTSRPPLIKQYLSADKAVNVINRDMQEAKNVINLLNKKAETKPGAITKPEAISVHRDANGWRFRLVASHFFKPGQFRMEREALATLDTVGNYLKSIGQKITIEGHTDDIPPSGEMTNLELSSLRASYAARYLVRNLDFPAGAVSIAGYGDVMPIADNDTPEGRQANRRIEIKVHYE